MPLTKEERLEFVESINKQVAKHAAISEEVDAKGLEIIKRRNELDETAEKDSDTYKTKMTELEGMITEQMAKRASAEEIAKAIEAAEPMKQFDEMKFESTPFTESAETGMLLQTTQKDKTPFQQQLGRDFWYALQKAKLTSSDAIKNNLVAPRSAMLRDGQKFNSAFAWDAAFGRNDGQIVEAIKHLGLTDLGWKDEVDALEKTKSNREAIKSMFTQVPDVSGGDGSLYNPTAIFAGNTGGLCEYQIDNSIDVLPYPDATFLDCIPVQQIAKAYLLFVRQTLRINNASGVGESVVLPNLMDFATGLVPNPIDFRPIKPESEYGFSQAKAHVITIANTIQMSEEMLEDCQTIVDIVEQQLMEDTRQEFYRQLIEGDGSGGLYPEITGLLSTLGMSTRIHQGAASFFGNTMGAGAVTDNVRDTLERAVFDGQAFGYVIDCIITSLEDYIEMAMQKDGTLSERKLYTDAEINTIRGARVRADVRMPAGTAIAGAFRRVVRILLRRALRLDIGWVDDQFLTDMLTMRATMRAGLKVTSPHGLIKITAL
jgi:hypothetical protein